MRKNVLIGQSGGPTVAINATLSGIVKGCSELYPEATIYGARNGIRGVLEDNLVKLNDRIVSRSDFFALETTPAAALGSCRLRLDKDERSVQYEQIFRAFRRYDVGVFFYIGGNDSMDTAEKLSRLARLRGEDVKVIGVPKTIDNDLPETDHTPGFGSAAKFVATTVQEIACDNSVYSDPSVTIVEIMGRHAGWLTAAAGIPRLFGEDCADLIYLPETEFNYLSFRNDVDRKLDERVHVIVAVSEGVHLADGTLIGSDPNGPKDAFGHPMLSGAGAVLAHYLKERLSVKVRSVELNVTQRCASHCLSATDISEAIRLGRFAVKTAFEGNSGVMVSYRRRPNGPYTVDPVTVPVSDVANKTKTVPLSDILPGNVTDSLLRRLAPLILGEIDAPRKNGLPYHFKI